MCARRSCSGPIEPWAGAFGAKAGEALRGRLARLADWLGQKDYLEGRFTAGDLMMACVLREVAGSPHLAAFPELEAYCARCQADLRSSRRWTAQLKVFDPAAAVALA